MPILKKTRQLQGNTTLLVPIDLYMNVIEYHIVVSTHSNDTSNLSKNVRRMRVEHVKEVKSVANKVYKYDYYRFPIVENGNTQAAMIFFYACDGISRLFVLFPVQVIVVFLLLFL